MKLYYAPGACSLADHIALHEAGLAFDHDKVDLQTKRTEQGEDYSKVNPKGYVPALVLDDGETLTENIAILDWIAHQNPRLAPEGAMGHTRLLEMLAYISTELHKSFKPFFRGAGDEEKQAASETIQKRLQYIADGMDQDYLFDRRFGVADAYLFVMLTWAKKYDIPIPERLKGFYDRMMARETVKTAMAHEGLEATS